MIHQDQLEEILQSTRLISKENLQEAKEKSKALKTDLAAYVVDRNFISEPILYQSIASALKVPFIDLRNTMLRGDLLSLIPEPMAQMHHVVAFDRTPTELKVACLDIDDLEAFQFIEKKTGLKILPHLTTPEGIAKILKQYHKGLRAEFKDITKGEGRTEATMDLKRLAEDLPVVRIIDTILEYAIYEGASDIHIEPTEKDTTVRYRIDGILREVMTLPKAIHTGAIARIKILSNLKIDEHRLPQDGRFKVVTSDYRVAFRVSVLPVFDGEKVVLRLLNESARPLTLEELGLQPKPLEILRLNIKKPHGVILVTGPTGSGKTTTLYSILNILNAPSVNISTVEDPIEYRMPGVNQCQVNAKIGFSFASGLRSLLRQDPNIIMVGEIRDNETAEIAINAAMTGHLVLSTLHTNDAVTTLPRLTEMGVPSFLIASTTNLVMAQRLVRKICTNCIQSYTLTKTQIMELGRQVNVENILSTLEKEGAIFSSKQTIDSLLFFRGKGCRQCSSEGYKGRIGIYEVLEVTPPVAELILNNASAAALRKAAGEQGMLTMLEDGFIKAKSGATTIEEVLRVTKE